MCLMQTDFPVPEGPRIIEIWLSGRPRLRPFSTRLRPKALTTSMNSTASSEPCSRFLPVCHWYSSASAWEPRSCVISPVPRGRSTACCSAPRVPSQSWASSGCVSASGPPSYWRSCAFCSSLRSSVTSPSPAYRGPRIGPPEDLRPDHSDQMDHHRVEHHGLRRRRAHSDRAAAGVVAVVAPDQHDHRRHRHALYEAVEQVGRVLEHPEDQEEAARRDLPDLLHDGEVAREEARSHGRDVHERQHHPGGEQAGGAQEHERVDAHHLERVDLVRDPHRADLRDEAGPDLRGHHVAERVRHQLAQVAPGAEDARVRGRADGAVEVRALDPALEAEDEGESPDHERGAENQDARLAQGLAEEVEHLPVEDRARDARAELGDVAERGDPVAWNAQPRPSHYLITEISGWVARSVWVNT